MLGSPFNTDSWIPRPQQELMEAWFKAPEPLLYRIAGPGGVGKSSLLRGIELRAHEESMPTVMVEAANFAEKMEAPTFLLQALNANENMPRLEEVLGILREDPPNIFSILRDQGLPNALDGIKEDLPSNNAQTIINAIKEFFKFVFSFWKASENRRRHQILSAPEEAIIKAIRKDMENGGVFIVDGWEHCASNQVWTLLDLSSENRIKTAPQGNEPASLDTDRFFARLAADLLDQNILFLIAGRHGEVPRQYLDGLPFGLRPQVSNLDAFTPEETKRFIRQSLSHMTPISDAALNSVQAVTHGNPFLLNRLCTILNEDRVQDPWTDIVETLEQFRTSDDSMGLLAYFNERIAEHMKVTGDKLWRLILPRTLTLDTIYALLDLEEGEDEGAGLDLARQWCEELEQFGLLRRTRKKAELYGLHDHDRDALTAWAQNRRKSPNGEAVQIHQTLALRYQVLRNCLPKQDPERSRLMLEEAYHRVMSVGDFAQKFQGEQAQQFWERLDRSLRIGPEERLTIAESLPRLEFSELEDLIERLNAEITEWKGVFKRQPVVVARLVSERHFGDRNSASDHLRDILGHSLPVWLWDAVDGVDPSQPDEQRAAFIQNAENKGCDDPNLLGNFAIFMTEARGDQDRAERLFEQAIAADPSHAINLGNFAIFMTDVRGDEDRAEQLYEQAIAADPSHANNLGNFALFMTDVRGDEDRAEQLYEQAIAADPSHANNLGNFALFMTDVRGDEDRAEQLYEQAIAADPSHANTLGNFAVFMKNVRGDQDRAEQLYEQAIAADPSHANTLGNFAVFMTDVRGDQDRAEQLYEQAMPTPCNFAAADPSHANTLGNFAVFMTDVRGDQDRAEQLYEQAIAADPSHANTLGNFANFMTDVRGDQDRAEQLYEQAIAADPSHANTLGNFANFMTDVRGDQDRAEQLYEQAIAADPSHANTLGNFAVFMTDVRGDQDRAEQLYEQAIAADPSHAGILGNYAKFLFMRGDDDEGLRRLVMAEQAAAKESGNGVATLLVELSFYRYAHVAPYEVEPLKAHVLAGVRCPGWPLGANVERAKVAGHPHPDLLAQIAAVISDSADPATLDEFSAWLDA